MILYTDVYYILIYWYNEVQNQLERSRGSVEYIDHVCMCVKESGFRLTL